MIILDTNIVIYYLQDDDIVSEQQHNLRTVDSVIAATAKTLSAQLASKDKSFTKLKGISLVKF